MISVEKRLAKPDEKFVRVSEQIFINWAEVNKFIKELVDKANDAFGVDWADPIFDEDWDAFDDTPYKDDK